MGRHKGSKRLRKKQLAKRSKGGTLDAARNDVSLEPARELVPISSLVDMAVESWRLEKWAADVRDAIAPRHVARRFARLLKELGIESVDLTGRPYDAGLAAEVLEKRQAVHDTQSDTVIEETVSPIVTLRGAVIRHAQVVIRGGTSE